MRALRRWRPALVVLLVAAVGTAVIAGLSRPAARSPSAAPAPGPSPQPVRTALLPPAGSSAPVPTSAGLDRALVGALGNRALGPRVAYSVVDVVTGRVLLDHLAGVGTVPASTAKIATAVAVLQTLPPDLRLLTRVVRGAAAGDVVLVGGGDPALAGAHPAAGFPAAARLADLAAAVRRSGGPVRRVLVDDSLFTGPPTGPGWKPSYVSGGDVAPVSALMVDGGRLGPGVHAPRSTDPALQAGRELAALLGLRSAVARTVAPPGAAVLARTASAPLAELVEGMLGRSDNDLAEALGRQVALHQHLPASFTGAATALNAVVGRLAGAGRFVLQDASGLSPRDRVQPVGLTRLLAAVSTDPRAGALLSGLPVAGFDGTLADRFRRGPAAAAGGVVRAKTGTLSGVSTLAGLVRTRAGRLLAFDLAADLVPDGGTSRSQAALDQVAASLASCGCA